MRKKLKIVLLMIVMMLCSLTTFSLANENVTITASNNEVKSGDTFQITVSQQSDGLTGFESSLSYDTNVFTLTKKELGSGWIDIGNEKKLDAMANSAISSGEIFKLTFSVKENVAPTTSEIKLTAIKLYKNSSDKTDFEDKSIAINVMENTSSDDNQQTETEVVLSKIEITKEPNTTNYKEGEQFNTNGMEVTATYSDNSTKKITNYTYAPNTSLKKENKLITISYVENGVTKSTTQAINVSAASNGNNNQNTNTNTNTKNNTSNTNTNKFSNNTTDNTTTVENLPKTGSTTKYILLIIAGLIGISFIAYKGYKTYKEI